MLMCKVGEVCHEDFSVTDSSDNLVPGITLSEFTYNLYNPAGVEATSILVTFDELGNGHYRANFVPDGVGVWMLIVYHSSYFSYGKSGTIKVYNSDFDTITTDLKRALGLMQENYELKNTVFDSEGNMTNCDIIIYDSASNVGTSSGIIAEYSMVADYTGIQLNSYKMLKV